MVAPTGVDPVTFRFSVERFGLTITDQANFFATSTGLEPATFAVTGRRANQLRHEALTFIKIRMKLSYESVLPTGFEPVLPP